MLKILKFVEESQTLPEEVQDKFIMEIDALERIHSMTVDNEVEAKKAFYVLPMATYNSFIDYVSYIDTEYAASINHVGAIKEIHTTRKSKKKTPCPNCGQYLQMVNNKFICGTCSYVDTSEYTPVKRSGENIEHSDKMWGLLRGFPLPPTTIINTCHIFRKWLTDRSFLQSYLNDMTTEQSLMWTNAYNEISCNPIDDMWFEDDWETYPTLKEFNILSSTFNTLLTSAIVKYNATREVNIPGLWDDVGQDLAELTVNTFIKIPSKFNYMEHYIYYMHEIFNVPNIPITNEEYNSLCEITKAFFKYFIKHSVRHSAPLWHVTFICILKLPYFSHLHDYATKFIASKSRQTTSKILDIWETFVIDEFDNLIFKYNTYQNVRLVDGVRVETVTDSISDLTLG